MRLVEWSERERERETLQANASELAVLLFGVAAGRRGRILAVDEAAGRYTVKLGDGLELRVKFANMLS